MSRVEMTPRVSAAWYSTQRPHSRVFRCHKCDYGCNGYHEDYGSPLPLILLVLVLSLLLLRLLLLHTTPSATPTLTATLTSSMIPTTFQPFNPSTLQPFNPSTLQPFNSATLQPFNPGNEVVRCFPYLSHHSSHRGRAIGAVLQ